MYQKTKQTMTHTDTCSILCLFLFTTPFIVSLRERKIHHNKIFLSLTFISRMVQATCVGRKIFPIYGRQTMNRLTALPCCAALLYDEKREITVAIFCLLSFAAVWSTIVQRENSQFCVTTWNKDILERHNYKKVVFVSPL